MRDKPVKTGHRQPGLWPRFLTSAPWKVRFQGLRFGLQARSRIPSPRPFEEPRHVASPDLPRPNLPGSPSA